MSKFDLILKNEKVRIYQMIRAFILLGNLAGMLIILAGATSMRERMWPVLVITCIVLYFVFAFVESIKKKFMYDNWARVIYLWSAIAWTKTDAWWLSVVMIAFAILDYLAHRKLVVAVRKEIISYPAFTNKRINWNEVNNIILKDGLLTIDLKNDQLFQHAVMNSDWDINEKEFNDFCRKQLTT